jgi:hypothetical protein
VPKKLFQHICIEGTGKGRIEFLSSKYTFTYESELSKLTNTFELGLDFPIVGEKRISLGLNPRDTAKTISHSDFVTLLKDQIGNREDRDQIINGVEEFFVLTSEFVQFRAKSQFPEIYKIEVTDDHFKLQRSHGGYLYEVDSSSDNQKYFERVFLRIFKEKSTSTGSILTLLLIPEACEK